jgi:hypothetical protein
MEVYGNFSVTISRFRLIFWKSVRNVEYEQWVSAVFQFSP